MIDTRRRTLDVARGTAASLVLLAVVIGVPFLLVTAIGWPLWESIPDLSRAGDLLDRGLPDRAFLNVVACLAWFVWAQFTLSVAVEVVATIRGRATRPVPGIPSSMQSGAARLVAVALLVATVLASRGETTTGHLPPVDQVRPDMAHVDATPDPVGTAMVDAASTATAAREWSVQRRDTLWGIAERTLGSGERYDEILQLNRNRTQPDGTALRSAADRLRVGWVLQLPADAVLPDDAPATIDGVYVVQPGDSLSAIAHRTLGDRERWPVLFEANRGRPQADGTVLTDPDVLSVGWQLQVPSGVPDQVVVREGDTLSGIADTFLGDEGRWPEIFEANRGVVQPDGRALSDPDEIDIGWTLTLPGSAARASDVSPPPPAPPPPAPPPAPAPVVDFTPVNLDDAAPYAAPDENEIAPQDEVDPDVSSPPASTDLAADTPASAGQPDGQSDDDTAAIGLPGADTDDPGGGPAPRTPATALGGAVAAGLVGLLSLLRARQRRRRRPDTVVPRTSDAGRRLEARLRAVADLDELTLVEWAVRSLSGSLADVPPTLSIRSVVAGEGGLELRLDRPLRTVPPGWHANGPSLVLDPAVDQDVLEALATGPDGRWSPMPVPALLPVGTTPTEPERSMFVDIEQLGVMALDGPGDEVDDVVRGLLFAALSSPWADECDLVVVGSLDLPDHLPWVRAASTLREAVDLLEARARRTREATADARVTSPVAARLSGAGESLRPLVAIVRSAPAHDDPLVERLAALESDGTGVAVVIGGSMPMVPNALVRNGEVELPDGVRVRTPTLTEAEHAEVAALLREAAAEPVAAGAPRLVRTIDGSADAEVRILGPVEVTVGQHTIGWKENGAVDLVAWLATHPDSDGSPRDALPFDEADWTRIVTEASLQLGVDESGHQRVVDAGRGLRGATTDLARFRSLVESASSTGHVALLDDALALVRGPAFGAGRHRPGWAHEIADQITTEVLAVVQRSLDAHERLGDVGAVRRALEVGVLADPGNESVWRQLLHAVDDDEGPDAAQACAIRMRSTIDRVAGRSERLEPETDALIERVQAAARESA